MGKAGARDAPLIPRGSFSSSSKSVVQAYNVQAVVDGEARVIVAAAVTQQLPVLAVDLP